MTERDESPRRHRMESRATAYRKASEAFAHWAAGWGVVRHEDVVQVRVWKMADLLLIRGEVKERDEVFRVLAAADRLTNAAMWLVAHMTYARNVHLDGRPLTQDDFKGHPEGHTGGSLNMVPGYIGYLALNAITGVTRSWLMGQGHCVAAIEATNLLVGNLHPEHASRYAVSDEGLTRFVRDFYSYEVAPDGSPASPLGSHVNPHTAGGIMEGGYLGFAELQYVHMPLPGQRLVAFLSDGAFEEQRGGDWASRYWRAEDSGMVAPIMIANGRRIDHGTTMAQQGGVSWFRRHLELNGFDPIDIDGRDPAAFAWAIFEIEDRLQAAGEAVAHRHARYPVPLPYAIAEAPKGYGFPGAGTHRAHNLPLRGHPCLEDEACEEFNAAARRLWVPLPELTGVVAVLGNHARTGRPRERDHALARCEVEPPRIGRLPWRIVGSPRVSPMAGLDEAFCQIVGDNPRLRPRLGNPDELTSNGMLKAQALLEHRVTDPDRGGAESVQGKIITALNEEAVVNAALGNKLGINLVVTYEAFAVKMLGALRQEILFSRLQRQVGRPAGWVSVPVVLSSHTWENGKNEGSHQDPTCCEALLGEMSDVSRVLFPVDHNSAVAALAAAYQTKGQIWTLVVPRGELPNVLDKDAAERLVADGGSRLRGTGKEPLLLCAVGSYQLEEVILASDRLTVKGVAHSVVILVEPGRYRSSRDAAERAALASPAGREALFPVEARKRIFVTHTRCEPLIGVLRPLDVGPEGTRVLGYLNQVGTLSTAGMLFANRCSWAHVLLEAAGLLDLHPSEFLEADELAAVLGKGDPEVILKQSGVQR